MPLYYNLQIEIVDVWGIDFMGPFPKFHDSEYILVAESSKKSSRKEIRYYYSTPKSSYSMKENSKANGMDRTLSSTLHHMAQS